MLGEGEDDFEGDFEEDFEEDPDYPAPNFIDDDAFQG